VKVLILSLFPLFLHAQSIEIVLKDYSTKTFIRNATVWSKKNKIATTDDKGKATIPNEIKTIFVCASGYDTLEVSLGSFGQTIYLSKRDRKLNEVKIKPIVDELANVQIRRMIQQFENLHPNKSNNYKFSLYNKITMDAPEDSSAQKLLAKDSEMADFVKQNKMFVWEKLTEAKHDIRFGEKNTVLVSNMSGFKMPIYELIAKSLDRFNYLPSVFRDKRYEDYVFRLEDTIYQNGQTLYEINFFPQRKFKTRKSRSGFVFIDSATGALIKYYGHTKDGYAEIENELINGYCFNKRIYYKMSLGMVSMNGFAPVAENRLKLTDVKMDNQFTSKEFRGNETDISLGLNDKKAMDQLAISRGNDTLEQREKNTFVAMDSLVRQSNVESKLKFFLALTNGFVKINKVNVSVNDLLRYNNYEGLRINLSLATNYSFHKNLYLNGFVGYGFKDQALKCGGGFRYMLDHYTQSQISIQAENDVFTAGRIMNDFHTPIGKLTEWSNQLNYGKYYRSRQLTMSYSQDVNRSLEAKISTKIAEITPLYNESTSLTDKEETVVSPRIQLHYYPGSSYVTTNEGKFRVKSRPTDIYADYQYIQPINNDGIGAHLANLEFNSAIKNPINTLKFTLKAGYTSDNASLWALQEGLGNSPRNNELYSSFGITSPKHFVTMMPSTFYSNVYTALFVQQDLPRIRTSASKALHASLAYKAIVGELTSTQYQGKIQSPSNIYQEVGLEFHKIFSLLGFGMYYRMGHYQQNGIENNVAFRINLGL
jgi:hypothetical protein